MNIAQAHAFCAALPGATLDDKWRFADSVHPVFSVGGRMFAMFSRQKDKLLDQLLFKTADDRFLALTDRAGIVPAPYLAKAKWVKLDTPKRLAEAELRALLVEAHALILAKATKKMQAAILAKGAGAATQATTAETATTKTTTAKRAAARRAAEKTTIETPAGRTVVAHATQAKKLAAKQAAKHPAKKAARAPRTMKTRSTEPATKRQTGTTKAMTTETTKNAGAKAAR